MAGSALVPAGLNHLAKANARKITQFTGPRITHRWAADYVDLCIPVRLADGSLLLVGGDTYPESGPPRPPRLPRPPCPLPPPPVHDWRCPTALRSHSDPQTGPVRIDGAVTDRPGHAKGLVNEHHVGCPPTTAIPSDVFRVGNTLYLHLMRGPLHQTHHTDFWKSTDNGETWTYLRWWRADMFGGQFQQKSYAAETDPSDPYVYVVSTAFDRDRDSGLLLFRVLKSDLDKTQADADASGWGGRYAYQGWGFANRKWAWGNEPTTITDVRQWGEICFRAMGGKYVLSWFQPNRKRPELEDIRAQVFPLPTSDLFAGTEQTMVYTSGRNPSSDPRSVQPFLYGGFIFPGSTFDNFNFAVSNWNQNGGYANDPQHNTSNYVVSQWRTRLNPNI